MYGWMYVKKRTVRASRRQERKIRKAPGFGRTYCVCTLFDLVPGSTVCRRGFVRQSDTRRGCDVTRKFKFQVSQWNQTVVLKSTIGQTVKTKTQSLSDENTSATTTTSTLLFIYVTLFMLCYPMKTVLYLGIGLGLGFFSLVHINQCSSSFSTNL